MHALCRYSNVNMGQITQHSMLHEHAQALLNVDLIFIWFSTPHRIGHDCYGNNDGIYSVLGLIIVSLFFYETKSKSHLMLIAADSLVP